MSDLTEFLLARIAEDEAVARKAQKSYQHVLGIPHYFDPAPGPFASPMVGMNPRAALAECDAKRRIIRTMQTATDQAWQDGEARPVIEHLALRTLRALASVYADRPDYREEWKP